MTTSERDLPDLSNASNPSANATNRDNSSSNYEGEVRSNLRYPIDLKHAKVKVRFKDISSDMPNFTNLNHDRLRQSARLAQQKLTCKNGDLVHNYFINFAQDHSYDSENARTMLERCFYAQELLETLVDNIINQISKFILSAIDNEAYHFKGMLRQPDRSEFIKAIEKEIDTHQRRNH